MKILMLLLISLTAFSQKIAEYTASNGITYHIGDTLKTGYGSAHDGSFVHVYYSDAWGFVDPNLIGKGLPATYNNRVMIVSKIKKSMEKVFLEAKNLSAKVDIEGAIKNCELSDCVKQTATQVDKYDQLKKLKELLDSGAITQEEFDKEKKKILDHN